MLNCKNIFTKPSISRVRRAHLAIYCRSMSQWCNAYIITRNLFRVNGGKDNLQIDKLVNIGTNVLDFIFGV